MREFDRDAIFFFLGLEDFKGMTREYMMDCVFDDEIQRNWTPKKGDVIMGNTANIFVISEVEIRHEDIGGSVFYFGGGSCNRDGGCALDETFCYTANESGKYYHPTMGEQENSNHSSIRDFRFIPYPHERNK